MKIKSIVNSQNPDIWKYLLTASLLVLIIIEIIWFSFDSGFDFSDNYIIANKSDEVLQISYANSDSNLGDQPSLSQIYEYRKNKVMEVPELAPPNYSTRQEIFKHTKSNLTWQSTLDYFVYGDSTTIHPGPPADIHGIINPYLLLYPDFSGLSIRSGLKWKNDGDTLEKIKNNLLPLFPQPSYIYWSLGKSNVDVSYNVSGFINRISPYLESSPSKSNITMDIVSFNAVDFGYLWGMLDAERSKSVTGGKEPMVTYSGFISMANGCGLEDGCNKRVNFSALNNLNIVSLPAKAVFKLWHEKPDNKDATENLTYIINFY